MNRKKMVLGTYTLIYTKERPQNEQTKKNEIKRKRNIQNVFHCVR